MLEQEPEILAFVQEHGDEGGGPEADEYPFEDRAHEVQDEFRDRGRREFGVVAEEGGEGDGEC